MGDDGQGIRQQLVVARAAVEKITKQLGKITEALLDDDGGSAPIAFVRKARELEAQRVVAEHKVVHLEYALAAVSGTSQPAQAEQSDGRS